MLIGRKNSIIVVLTLVIAVIGVGLILLAGIDDGNTETGIDAGGNGAPYDKSGKTVKDEKTNTFTSTPKQSAELEEGMNEKTALAIAQRFCDDMANSWLKLERPDMSEYLVDNLDTHLALRWIDFDIADRLQNTWKKLISLDSVVLSGRKFKKVSEKRAILEAFAEIKYTRYEPGVKGIGVDLTLTLENMDGTWKITGADTRAASVYGEWKKGWYTTIEEMDKAFWASCKEKGLVNQAKKLLKD